MDGQTQIVRDWNGRVQKGEERIEIEGTGVENEEEGEDK